MDRLVPDSQLAQLLEFNEQTRRWAFFAFYLVVFLGKKGCRIRVLARWLGGGGGGGRAWRCWGGEGGVVWEESGCPLSASGPHRWICGFGTEASLQGPGMALFVLQCVWTPGRA